LALVALRDELRPEAGTVLRSLAAQGIAFKVLSGDHPATVQATVRQLELGMGLDHVISGDEFEAAEQKQELVERCSVFGRVSPHQKVRIVELLEAQGHHVGMIGDGVNDILPIKQAHLGIAMGAGSQATKAVAGLVLENNDFALLPETLEEGRTIVRNLRRSSKLFLVKNVYSLILIIVLAWGFFTLPFPYLPQQVTLLNWLVIGIPAFVIALSRERSAAGGRPAFLREVGTFAVRTGIVFSLAGLAVLVVSPPDPADARALQRTLLLTTLILLGVSAVFRALADGESKPLAGDSKHRLLALLAAPAYAAALYWGPAASFFQLHPLAIGDWFRIALVAAAAYGISRLTDKWLSPRRRVP
jgi:cation-transporting ATPase E